MEAEDGESVLKFIVIGDTEVGKSSLMLQLVEQRFQPEHEMTFGVECASYRMTVDNHLIDLEIWDTAGQEAYMSITRSYYRNADGCILVYDITRQETFQNLPRWLREAEENTNNPQLVTILVGNKADLSEKRQVTTQEAAEFAAANGLMFMEVSVRTGFADIEKVFTRATRRIIELQNEDIDDYEFSSPAAAAGEDEYHEPASPTPSPARAPAAAAGSGAGGSVAAAATTSPGRRKSPVPAVASPVRPAATVRLTSQDSIKLTGADVRNQKVQSECACN